jgi:F420-0:gamma-glutamyl ligase-like protein
MSTFRALVITTKYWRPGENYSQEIIKSVKDELINGDFVILSEKAISTALNNIVDENTVEPNLSAKLIARFWMQMVWGYVLGKLCHLRNRLIYYLRNYPLDAGSRHKQLALQHSGLLQALMFGSEGGIDGSNLPYSYVCLPLKNAGAIAKEIQGKIWLSLHRRVFVIIVDTDKTYSLRNFHFTPRPKPIGGIHSFGGFMTYVLGRSLKLKRRSTPIAVAGCKISVEGALEIAEVANRARGFGAGRTVWDMAARFKVKLTGVSWEMLETVKHKPIVIVRSKR